MIPVCVQLVSLAFREYIRFTNPFHLGLPSGFILARERCRQEFPERISRCRVQSRVVHRVQLELRPCRLATSAENDQRLRLLTRKRAWEPVLKPVVPVPARLCDLLKRGGSAERDDLPTSRDDS